ncbi:probable G-protein coupled receptor Mth-like 7 [Drosophila biarmipes]|uniref:probable G-protein coupled receptor Mth-like 7 n=1 Tax=Drosophila biarmipes TaxID=125945 RepID=UPI001CDB2E51|nr:probable G-protein coupled receptor Mth-like 7 [Drosophila biarmipes]
MCEDDLQEKINLTILNLMEDEINTIELLVIRDQFRPCTGMVAGGMLYFFEGDPHFISIKSVCFYPHESTSMWLIDQRCVKEEFPETSKIRVISLLCYVLTLLAYLYVKKLRNVLGKSLISCFFCKIAVFLIDILDSLSLVDRICALAGYIKYFSLMASYIWFSVISYHLWNTLTSMRRVEPRNQFLRYSAIAWGIAAIPPGVIYVINQVFEEHNHLNWMPVVGFSNCFVNFGQSFYLYHNGPLMVLGAFNVVQTIRTVVSMRKVKSELKKFDRNAENTICCNFAIQKNLMFFRICFIMGLFWILDTIYILNAIFISSILKALAVVVLYFKTSSGVFFFLLLVFKSSTLKLLMDEFRKGR